MRNMERHARTFDSRSRMLVSRSSDALVVMSLVMLVLGCSTPIAPMQTSFAAPRRVVNKNYTLGAALTAYVGDSAVTFKDYYVKTGSQNRIRASNNFTVNGVFVNFVGQKDQEFNVVGTTTRKGSLCYIVALPPTKFLWPIKATGEFCGKALNDSQAYGWIEVVYSYKIDPLIPDSS